MGCMGQPSVSKTEYYKNMLFLGQWYEDYLYVKLEEKLKIKIDGCNTQGEQRKIGENHLGWEIKFDDNYKTTGNLFIEYCEKPDEDKPEFRRSGVLKEYDNSWLYLIGDEKTLYFFAMRELANAYYYLDEDKNPIHERKPSKTGTSWGFLLKGQEEINRYALKTLIL